MNVALKIKDENLLEEMESSHESLTFALLEARRSPESKGPQHLPLKITGALVLVASVCLSLSLWGNLPVG